MLTFDISSIELYVTENNPKTLNALIKNDTYKIRAIVERTINHFKINICIALEEKQEIIPPQNQMSFLQASPAS